MKARRIVTGVDANGKSTFVSDGPPPRSHDFVHVPGHSSTIVWATDGSERAPNAGDDPTPRETVTLDSPRNGLK